MSAEDPGQGPIPQPGLFTSLRNLATTLVAVAQTRLELLSAEIEEEQVRLLQILLGSLIALFFSALGVVMLTLFVVAWFWESHRALVIILLAMASETLKQGRTYAGAPMGRRFVFARNLRRESVQDRFVDRGSARE